MNLPTFLDVHPDEAAELTAHLVSFRSYPGEEGDVQRAVAAWLAGCGIASRFQATQGDRPNVIAALENGAGPTLLLNGHVDTVLAAEGWLSDPWTARREGDRLYGLGAADMKAGVAANMLIARALHQHPELWHGTLIFTSVVDEEAYSIGARALVDARIQADACFVTEPSGDHAVIGGVGKVLVRGEVYGKASHGSNPRAGINAAVEAARLVARLDELDLGAHPRMEVSQSVLGLHSGSAQYVITVPERATFTINRHTIPGQDDESVLAQMSALAESLHSPARFAFQIDPPYYPPWEVPASDPAIQRLVRAYAAEYGQELPLRYAEGVADANYFAADLGIPTFWFGPLGEGLHQCNEWVDVPSIAATVRIGLRYALDLMGK